MRWSRTKKEPVASPGDIAADLAIVGHFDFQVRGEAIARNVVHGDFAVRVQNGAHGSDGSLDAVLAGLDAIQKGEGRDEADGAVTTHAEVSNIIKEDDAGGAGGINGIAEQRADDYVGASRLVHDCGTKIIVLAAKTLEALGKRAGAEIGASTDNDASGFASGVGVDDANSAGRMRRSFLMRGE